MFAGVGSLSKICLTFGADHVDCVESNGKVINANLVQVKGKYNLIERDAFSFSITENYDLIILDPFFDQSYRVDDLILSNINNYGSLIVMDIGPKFDTFWSRRVLSRINNIRFRKFSIADQVICVFKKEAF
jgi:16S rRNA G966 N2-methylase RsmD